MPVVYGAFSTSTPRTSTAGTQSRLHDAMSQYPALGEQWIEEVTDVEECLEGEKLKFKAHIRGWKTEIRKERCQQLLDKNGYNLRRALLRPVWKDVLLIPRDWYPEYKPR